MRSIIAGLLVSLALWGQPASAEETTLPKTQIENAATADWSAGLDVMGLSRAATLCRTESRDEPSCKVIEWRGNEIAVAASSCEGQEWRICRALLNTLKSDLGTPGAFGRAPAIEIPAHPLYWKIGNELLDTRMPDYYLRGEILRDWWVNRWPVILLTLGLGILVLRAAYFRTRAFLRLRESNRARHWQAQLDRDWLDHKWARFYANVETLIPEPAIVRYLRALRNERDAGASAPVLAWNGPNLLRAENPATEPAADMDSPPLIALDGDESRSGESLGHAPLDASVMEPPRNGPRRSRRSNPRRSVPGKHDDLAGKDPTGTNSKD